MQNSYTCSVKEPRTPIPVQDMQSPYTIFELRLFGDDFQDC